MPMTQTEHRFPCAQCGASLRFAPGQDRLTCEYCGHAQDIPGLNDDERVTALETLDYHAAVAQTLPAEQVEETRVTSCPNCGAQVTFGDKEHASQCPFCATPVVADTGMHRHIKPQAVIPFRLTERDAHDKMNQWLKKLWFAPNGLAQYARNDRRLDGLYVPYWAFDADTTSDYQGARGTYYYVSVSDGKGGTRRERRTRWTPASGRVGRRFMDVLIMASTSLPRRYVRKLEPWTLSELERYNPQYLSGFRAEGYSVDLSEGFVLAKERMAEVITQDARRDIGGDEQRITAIQTKYADERFKHLLLPIWVAAYRYRGKSYRFVVNAQSGRVQGERPWSAWKIALTVLLGLLLLAGAFYLAEFA